MIIIGLLLLLAAYCRLLPWACRLHFLGMSDDESDDSSVPSLREQSESDDEEVLSLDQLRQSILTSNRSARSNGLAASIASAERARQEGNNAMNGDVGLAAHKYEEVMMALWPFESTTDAAWSLILCLSNHALAAFRQEQYDQAIDSCDNGLTLLTRHSSAFPRAECDDKVHKLEQRREMALQAIMDAETAAKQLVATAAAADEAAARSATDEAEAAAAAQPRAEAEAVDAGKLQEE